MKDEAISDDLQEKLQGKHGGEEIVNFTQNL